jgi:RNA recognition motif-containing protein
MTHRDSGRSKGLAFVKFDDKESMDKAIANNKIEHMGRWLVIEEAAAFGTYGAAGG